MRHRRASRRSRRRLAAVPALLAAPRLEEFRAGRHRALAQPLGPLRGQDPALANPPANVQVSHPRPHLHLGRRDQQPLPRHARGPAGNNVVWPGVEEAEEVFVEARALHATLRLNSVNVGPQLGSLLLAETIIARHPVSLWRARRLQETVRQAAGLRRRPGPFGCLEGLALGYDPREACRKTRVLLCLRLVFHIRLPHALLEP
mmetsp:Transcript_36900/g.110227  ORF Transcript_36900/g.110227 Transcript_36900/m.110227 type:complete len:203 (-) Transcript_36900:227-835(-)